MALNFPVKQNIPEDIGFEYTDATTEITWIWDGYSWNNAASGGASVVASATAPDEPEAGDMWWDTNSGKLKIYYDDGSSLQWVDAFNINGALSVDLTGYATTSALNTYAPLSSPIFAGNVTLPSILEKTNIVNGTANGAPNIDLDTAAVWYFTTNNSANWTMNIRASSTTTFNNRMAVGQSVSIAVAVTNGATPYWPSGFTIDGVSVTRRWQGGTAPTGGNANSIDVYTITIIKTAASTYTVLAAQTKF
jgi:hypothetical protein